MSTSKNLRTFHIQLRQNKMIKMRKNDGVVDPDPESNFREKSI